jgi:hypothetical protein
MRLWHGYLLITKPPHLPMGEWQAVWFQQRKTLDKKSADPSPARRLHGRCSLDGSQELIEGVFDLDQLAALTYAREFPGDHKKSADNAREWLMVNAEEWEGDYGLQG